MAPSFTTHFTYLCLLLSKPYFQSDQIEKQRATEEMVEESMYFDFKHWCRWVKYQEKISKRSNFSLNKK